MAGLTTVAALLSLILVGLLVLTPKAAHAQSQSTELPLPTTDRPIDRFTIYGFELKDRLAVNGDGHYYAVMRQIFKDVSYAIDFQLTPIPRAAEKAESLDRVCVFPTTSEMMDISFPKRGFDRFIDGTTIDLVSGHVYRAPGLEPISSFSEVKGLVGHLSGGAIRNILLEKLGDQQSQVEFVSINSEFSLVQMLMLGRIDYLIGHHPDVPLAIERLGSEQLVFNPDLPLFTVPVTLSCRPFDQHKQVFTMVNQRIEEANRSGLLSRLLGPYANVPHLDQITPRM